MPVLRLRSPRAGCLRTCGRGPASGRRHLAQAATDPAPQHPGLPGPRCCCAESPLPRSPPGGWPASAGKAAALIGASGFADRVRELLRDAPAVHADETPARAAGGMRYVHLACTALPHAHAHRGPVRGRHRRRACSPRLRRASSSATATSGYSHLTGALHAWCGARLLQGPEGPLRLRARKAGLGLADGRPAHRGPRRRAGRPRGRERGPGPGGSWAVLVTRYRALAADGRAANITGCTATAGDARRIARRFLNFEDMILRFATRPDLDIFTNNEAERTIRPVKVQQRKPQEAAGGQSRDSPISP